MTIFPPTYLYIKQHSITGKCYFGKTTAKDPVKYLGSGLHWARHIKIHGKEHIETLWFKLFTDQSECTRVALLFSEQQDIVKSDRWLNFKPENGLDGGKQKGIKFSAEHMEKWQKAGQIAAINSPNHPSKNSEVIKKIAAISAASPNHISKNVKNQQKWQAAGTIAAQKRIICPHCKKEGILGNMHRWHFDNCRFINV